MNANNEIIAYMLRSANEFLEISSNAKTFIPNFVNMAFSCELYLKTILEYKNGCFPKIHDMKELYEKVFTNIKEDGFLLILVEEINNSFNALPEDNFHVCTTSKDAKEILYQMFDGAVCSTTGEVFIEGYKNLYVDWRYIFEGKVQKPYTVDMTALKRYVETMVKEVVQND